MNNYLYLRGCGTSYTVLLGLAKVSYDTMKGRWNSPLEKQVVHLLDFVPIHDVSTSPQGSAALYLEIPLSRMRYACTYACISHAYNIMRMCRYTYTLQLFILTIISLYIRAASGEVTFSASGGSYSASGERFSASGDRSTPCGCGPKKKCTFRLPYSPPLYALARA